MRNDGRQPLELRPVNIQRGYTKTAPGSVLIEMGNTRVLCTVSITDEVPRFLEGKGKGWLTSEYSMLPGSTVPRKSRDRSGKIDGRSVEIQRLIGRSLRNVVRLDLLGERTAWVDCDVLDADGGTRTASITGAYVALIDALHTVEDIREILSDIIIDSVAAISVGIISDIVLVDLDYSEDCGAGVDMNLVMTGAGNFIEVQGTGENCSFTGSQLQAMLTSGQEAIQRLTQFQKAALGDRWIEPRRV